MNKIDETGMADPTAKNQLTELDKKIESFELKKIEIDKEKKQFLTKIKNLKTLLGLTYKEEGAIESEVVKIEAQEKKTIPPTKVQIEKKRWKVDAERREAEKTKWQILDEIKEQEKQIKEVDLRYEEVLKEGEQLKKEREEIFRKKLREKMLQEKANLKNDFFQLSDRKKTAEVLKNDILMQKERLETELEKTLEKEKITEDALEVIESKEREISVPEKKREIEKERWKMEDNRKGLEEKKWELEKEKNRLSNLLKEKEVEYQQFFKEENLIKEKVKTINLELGIPYIEEEEFRKKEIFPEEKLIKPIELPEEEEKPEKKLEKIEIKIPEVPRPAEEKKLPVFEKEIKKQEEEKKLQEKGVEEEIKKKEEEYRNMLKKALDSYKNGEFTFAKELLDKVIAAEEIKEKKPPGFLARVIRGASLQERANALLKKVKKQEEKIQTERQRAKGLEKKEEKGTAETAEKETEEVKKREELKRYQEELVKKYPEELKARKKEITERYENDLEELMNKLVQEEEKFKIEGRALEELEREFENQKIEIKEKYEQEFEMVKKELEEGQLEELKALEEKLKTEEEIKKAKEILRKEEEPKIQEAEVEKIQELPKETLSKEEEPKKKEVASKAEEKTEEKSKIMEEETKIIEEEIKRKQTEGKQANIIIKEELPVKEESYVKEEIPIKAELLLNEEIPVRREPVFKGETDAEKEKRRLWLKVAVEKEKEMMTPEEIEREQKEKTANLKRLFEEAIFHYKEDNLDRAIEIFQELKKSLPEPKREPGFFSRIFGRISLYIKIEDYISKIEKQKIFEEKIMVKDVRESARIAAMEKRKERYWFFPKLKRKIGKWLPPSPLVILRKFLFLPPLIAIDISDYSIELLHLNKNRSILSYGRSIIKEGIVREGVIKDQKELSLAFKLAVNQAGFKPFRPKLGPILRGVISVPEFKTNVQVFTFKSKENIFDKVKEEVKKTIPFPIDELYWNYLEVWDEKLNEVKVLCVAVLKDIIDEQVCFLKSSGVEPAVFDFEAASIGRALLPEKIAPKNTGTIILDIGSRITNINIFDENDFISSSTAIPSGGDYLGDKIAEYFGISKEEAGTILGIKGFHKEDNIMLEVLEKEMEEIVEATREAIKYYQVKTEKEIKKIILSGGTALLPKIDKFFQGHFPNIEIEIGDPLKKIKRRGGIDATKAVIYANSIGLALRSINKDPVEEGINLLPLKIKEKEKKVYWQGHRRKLIIIRVILAVLVIAVALLIYLLFNYHLVDEFL